MLIELYSLLGLNMLILMEKQLMIFNIILLMNLEILLKLFLVLIFLINSLLELVSFLILVIDNNSIIIYINNNFPLNILASFDIPVTKDVVIVTIPVAIFNTLTFLGVLI